MTGDPGEHRILFPFQRRCPFAAPSEFAELHPGEPVRRVNLYDGSEAWLVTGYDEVRSVLGDPRFSAEPERENYPFPFPSRKADLRHNKRSFLFMDPPDHTRLRKMLTAEFTVKKVEQLRPYMQECSDRLIDDIVGRGTEAELVQDFAIALPTLVISCLLGVPYDDRLLFQECTKARLDGSVNPEKSVEAAKQIHQYLYDLINAKLDEGNDDADMLARLVGRYVRTGEITIDEAVSMADLLLLAGHETSGNTIASSFAVLLRDRVGWETLVADPARIPGTVEELLRFVSPSQTHSHRTAIYDVDVAGHTIRAGEGVIAMLYAANWDPAVFPRPEVFDVDRDARMHLAFGYGIHQCLGQALARMEMQISLSTFVRRLPSLRLSKPWEEIEFLGNGIVFGPKELQCTW